jgi:hypothetical protein
MSIGQRFMAYATDFEKTLADDDWSRLAQYFSPDAVYRVESSLFGCELTGHDAIFSGMKKSLDGFDRHFPAREIQLTEGPEVEGNELRASWAVTYHKEGLPDFVLRGSSRARIEDDEIVLLVDSYEDVVNTEVADWMREAGVQLDPSYV